MGTTRPRSRTSRPTSQRPDQRDLRRRGRAAGSDHRHRSERPRSVWPETRQAVGARLPMRWATSSLRLRTSRRRHCSSAAFGITAIYRPRPLVRSNQHRAATVPPSISRPRRAGNSMSGPSTRGHQRVEGLRCVAVSRARRLPYAVGDPLTPKAMTDARDGITAMGVFATVDVRARPYPEPAPIRITVKEAPFQTCRDRRRRRARRTSPTRACHVTYTNKNLGTICRSSSRAVLWVRIPPVHPRPTGPGPAGRRSGRVIQPRIFR